MALAYKLIVIMLEIWKRSHFYVAKKRQAHKHWFQCFEASQGTKSTTVRKNMMTTYFLCRIGRGNFIFTYTYLSIPNHFFEK